tara:strand:+ start:514 stop:789 length:276 start_codon:yes stop_codon:yes gene_type:complete
MIELVSIVKTGETWYLNKVVVNSQYITTVSESQKHNTMLKEGKIHIGLNEHVTFSSITLDTKSGFDEMIVVGSPEQLLEKIKGTNKQLLKG